MIEGNKDAGANSSDLGVKSNDQKLSEIQVDCILKEMELINKMTRNVTGVILRWRYFFFMIIVGLITLAESPIGDNDMTEDLVFLALWLAIVLFLIEAIPHDWQISSLYRIYELDRIITEEVIQRDLSEFVYRRRPAKDIWGKIKNLIGTPGYVVPHCLLITSISVWILRKEIDLIFSIVCEMSFSKLFAFISFPVSIILLILCYSFCSKAILEKIEER